MTTTRKKHAKRLVFFNHKGGVGKTTLTINLAYALVASGKRVLIVDTDPQCSLSSFFLEESFLDRMLDESESAAGNTIWSALQPVSEGTGPLKQIKPVKITDALHVAVGDIRLSGFENSLADCWNQCLTRNRRGYNCTAALSTLVDGLASDTRADFVFFDAGPNIGPLNRIVILDCTHFIVPAACDLFSSRALKTLGFAMSEWVTTWERIKEQAPDQTPLLEGRPMLLGYIPQGFRVYRGEMAQGSFRVLSKLESRIVEFVWKPIQTAYAQSTKDRPSNLKLGQIKFFGTIVTDAQSQGTPLWQVSGGNASAKNEAHAEFLQLAKLVIARTA
jgi:cellulose biosynthesis protein BcsQ